MGAGSCVSIPPVAFVYSVQPVDLLRAVKSTQTTNDKQGTGRGSQNWGCAARNIAYVGVNEISPGCKGMNTEVAVFCTG